MRLPTINRRSPQSVGLCHWYPGHQSPQTGSSTGRLIDAVGVKPAAIIGATGAPTISPHGLPTITFDGSTGYANAGPISGAALPFTNTGCTYDSALDCLWVGDFTNTAVVRLDKLGNEVSRFSVPVKGGGLQGIAYDSGRDELWIGYVSSKQVYRYSKAGVQQAAWLAADNATDSNGVAWEEAAATLWVSSSSSGVLQKYDATGTNVGSLTLTTTTGPDGLLYDVTRDCLWVTIDGSLLRQHNKTTGAVIATYQVGDNIEHVALDTSDDTLWLNHDRLFHSSILQGNRLLKLSTSAVYQQIAGLPGRTGSYGFDGYAPFSVSMWFMANTLPASSAHLARFAQSAGSLYSWYLFVRSTGTISSFINPSAVDSATGLITTGQWYLVTATYDGATLSIYLNGKLVASGSRTMTVKADADFLLAPDFVNPSFDGRFADVRLYNRVLSPAEAGQMWSPKTRTELWSRPEIAGRAPDPPAPSSGVLVLTTASGSLVLAT